MTLVVNCGSSSIKCAVFRGDRRIRRFLVEEITSYQDALEELFNQIDFTQIDAVVHRVVHGGERFTKATPIDNEVLRELQKLSSLAPLHNPANLEAIQYVRNRYPNIPQVAVFDTAFFSTLPQEAYTYAIETKVAKRYGIRRYGFHGNSHGYLLDACATLLARPKERLNLITLHLGNGASICAIENGKSVDISMGFTPLEGLVMGSRCGDIDAGAVLYLQKTLATDAARLDEFLNKRSGLVGLCQESDMRKILRREDEDARLALAVYVRRIKKYIGAYTAILPHVDAIVFSGGIGENSAIIRRRILEGLEKFGILIDYKANEKNMPNIAKRQSAVKIFVIATDEETYMLRRAKEVL